MILLLLIVNVSARPTIILAQDNKISQHLKITGVKVVMLATFLKHKRAYIQAF